MNSKRLTALAVVLGLATSAPIASAAAGGGDAARIRAALRAEPFFTELFVPSRAPEGIAITFHRGAWTGTGAQAAAAEHADDRAWMHRRWLVVNSSYRPGTAGLADVRDVYRRVRRATRDALPICMIGASSGGNLALLAATRLPDLACLVAEAAPADLVDIGSQQAYDGSAESGSSSTGPAYIHDVAIQALGADNLRPFSPLYVATRIKARVLLAEAEQDPLIPAQQLDDLCGRLAARCAGSLRLAPGPLSFVHAGVSRPALAQYRRAESRLAHLVAQRFARSRS
ncbi:MAG: alpha/beta hydrolase family protein [Solirubrobacteraceae bacterium]